MNKRLEIIYSAIKTKCNTLNTDEFEYYTEIWGVMWYPWFLEIGGKSQSFNFNDLSSKDLDKLCELNKIELLEIFKPIKMKTKLIGEDIE